MSDTKIKVNGDEFLKKHYAWAKGEETDASRAGTRREAIGQYAEKTGLNNKAMSQIRSGLKMKDSAKRRDWVRSLQILLEIAEKEIFDEDPELPMTNPNEDQQKADAAAMVADQSNEAAEAHNAGDGEDAPGDDEAGSDDGETLGSDGKGIWDGDDAGDEEEVQAYGDDDAEEEELDQDAEDFDQAADEALGDNVKTVNFAGAGG